MMGLDLGLMYRTVAEAVGAGSASTVSGSSLMESTAMESTAFALGVVAATCGFGGAAIGYTEPEDLAFSLSLWTSLARVM